MSELLTVAIGAIGALIGLVGLMVFGGGVFLVVLFFRKLPVGFRAALSTAATYCVAVTVMRSYALQAMDLIMLRSMLNACCIFGLSGLCLSLVGSSSLENGPFAIWSRRNRLAGIGGVYAARKVAAIEGKNNSFMPCEFVKVSPVLLI